VPPEDEDDPEEGKDGDDDALDEPVRSPAPSSAAVGYPVGFPTPQPGGGNFLPDLLPRMAQQSGRPQTTDGRVPGEAGSDYIEPDADPIEGVKHGGGEGSVARQFLSQYPDDVRVSVRVWEAQYGRNVPRGYLEDVLVSWAAMPERYIPYGGKWHVEVYSAMTGKLLDRINCVLPGKSPPEDWRVETMVDPEKLALAIAKALQSPSGVPSPIYSDSVGALRQELQDIKRDMKEAQDARWREREQYRDELFKLRLEAMGKQNGHGNGPSDSVALVTAFSGMMAPMLAAVTAPRNDPLVDIFLKTQGPDAMTSMAAVYNTMMESLAKSFKMTKGGGETEDTWGKIAEGAGKFMGAMQAQQKEAREAIEKQRREQREHEVKLAQQEAAARAAQPRQPVGIPRAGAQPQQPAQPEVVVTPEMQTNRALADRMIAEVKARMIARDNPMNVGRGLAVMAMNMVEFRLGDTDEFVRDLVMDFASDPEGAVAKFGKALSLEPEYVARISMSFRQASGMPPLAVEEPVPSPAPAAVPTGQAPLPPEPGERPLPTKPSPAAPVPVDVAGAGVEPGSTAIEGMVPPTDNPAPASPAPASPSGEFKSEDAVAAVQAEVAGADHVVPGDLGGQPGEGVQGGDPQDVVGQPVAEDGVRVGEPPQSSV
jgi:hypothetical protein